MLGQMILPRGFVRVRCQEFCLSFLADSGSHLAAAIRLVGEVMARTWLGVKTGHCAVARRLLFVGGDQLLHWLSPSCYPVSL